MNVNPLINYVESSDPDNIDVLSLEFTSMAPGGLMTLSFNRASISLGPTRETIEAAMINHLIGISEYKGVCDSAIYLNMIANEIARETRRGAGNYVIYHMDDEQKLLALPGISTMINMGMVKFQPSQVTSLRGILLMRYKGRVTPPSAGMMATFDGTPIMAIHESSAGFKMLQGTTLPQKIPGRTHIGFYNLNAHKYVKSMHYA